jgi:hypothetical protein
MQQKKYLSAILPAMLTVLLAGCGSSYNGSGTNPNTAPVTGIKKRVLVSDVTITGGGVIIVDAQKNTFGSVSTGNIPVPIGVRQPSKMLTASGQTVMLNSTTAQITIFNNSTEQVTATTSMQDQPFDVAISPDGQTAYAAIKTVGVVEVVNTTTGNLVGTMTVPAAARLVEGPKGHKMLAFADSPQTLLAPNTNGFFVIDTGTNTVTTITGPGLDQPYTAIFDPADANDTTAFILNCGPECGGTTASVIKVNFGGATPTFSAPIPVSAATVALLNGSNLFVAGTPATQPAGCTLAACGTVQVINTGSLTATAPVNITNGLHGVMALTSNNKLYIGATGCSVGPISPQNTVQGCLSIFDTGAGPSATNPVFPIESSFRQNFDVTGLQPISNENTVYVAQGGEIDIFDINTSAPSTIIQQLDLNGRVMDALQIDP